MDILQYLITLLKTHKEVGVEGLGTFIKKKVPGRYDVNSHSFVPPSQFIELDKELKENSLLKNFIKESRNISEGSAQYFIDQFGQGIKKSLENGKVHLENLGSIHLVDGNIQFTASENSKVGFDFFALPTVSDSHKEDTKTETPENNIETDNITEEPIAIKEDSQSPIIEEIVEQEELPHTEVENTVEQAATKEVLSTETSNSETDSSKNENSEESINIVGEENIIEHPILEEEPQTALSTEETEANIEPETTLAEDNKEKIKPVADIEVAETIGKNKEASSTQKEELNPLEEAIKFIQQEENQAPNSVENIVATTEEVIEEKKEKVLPIIEAETPTAEEEVTIKSTNHQWDFSDAVRNPKELEEEEEPVNQGTLPLYLKISLIVLAIISIAAIIFYVSPDAFNVLKKKEDTSNQKMVIPVTTPNLKSEADSLSFADSIMNNAKKVGLEVEPAKDTLKVTSTTHSPEKIYTFDIIAAAFAKESEAQEYIAYMKKKGYEAKIANMPGKLFKKISIASYNNLDSAEFNLSRLKKQLKNDKIYIQKIKNN